MKVSEIISTLTPLKIEGSTQTKFSSLSLNSRDLHPEALFFAIKGSTSDGHDYIANAITAGASVIICEVLPQDLDPHCTYLLVDNSSKAMGLVAHQFYDNPSSKLNLIGVTGTNGKTTIATLLYELFTDMDYCCGLISTITNRIGDKIKPATHTTPDAINLNALLCEMVETSCSFCFMEVSSHAIDQQRTAGLVFKGGIFTNLTRDHLDYHGTFDNYLKTKKSFFDQLPKNSFALSNADDKNGLIMLQNTKAVSYTYSIKNQADFKAKVIESRMDGMLLNIDQREVWTHLTGDFNAQNVLAVVYAAFLLEQDLDTILMSLSKLKPVSGRTETMMDKNKVTGIVDYAHTPDALNKVLKSINNVKQSQQQLICVVGAGGNRDQGKRPLMTQEALKGSSKVILTSDNPRKENPSDIIKNMLEGVSAEQMKNILIIEDREQAIRTAYSLCKPGDLFVVAGKGHENYQDINGIKHPFSDQEIIKQLFN